ncbi:MAG: class I poly(R)-hydroxyalkanoic acid synthase [Alphaproteobacteria bacterium]
MNDQQGPGPKLPDSAEISRTMAGIAERTQRIVTNFINRNAAGGPLGHADPFNVGAAFLELTARMLADPAKLVRAQMSLWEDYMNLWQSTARRMMGQPAEPVVTSHETDRRFKDQAWDSSTFFDYIKQSYLLSSRWLQSTVREVEGLDDKTARKVDFYTRQFVDALSPTNFVVTNPEVLRATIETGGENLVRGLTNLLDDLERGEGRLKIKMTDTEAFKVGENLATTPGKVIFQNELMQLIQYDPSTKEVYERPLLIMPPWINKYYVLDMREKNSFIRWAVGQGFTVFVISWVNPDEKLALKTFEDYMIQGPLVALDVIAKATGEKEVNVLGYCLGGTLLASLLAYMAAKGDKRIKNATFLTTMIDFTEAGELSVFIDEEQLAVLENRMNQKGYLEGHEMATTFNMLRANDLIWSFVVNNYLLGKDPFPFDLLYWNGDSTRMPAAMHSFYLRTMYQENRLKEAGGIVLAGVPIDVTKIDVPAYVLSTREDHIAPWMSAYAATQILKGSVRFVLSASGHIAGVVNPPAANKYCYWTNPKTPADPNKWLAGAKQKDGSWWVDWGQWLADRSGKMVPSRKPGGGKLKPIEDAPGAYVKVQV